MKIVHTSLVRKNICAFLILLAVLLNSFMSNAQNTATISGTVEPLTTISAQLAIDRLHLGKKIEINSAELKNGEFHFTINLDHGYLVELTTNNIQHKIYLEPGDNLQLQIKDSAVIFSGKGAEQNFFLKKFYRQYGVTMFILLQERLIILFYV